jgi:SagB-type dehydrogenase family enzyme
VDEPFPSSAEVRGYYEKHLKGKKQPPIYKTYTGHSKVRLPRPSSPKASLFGTLRSRTTMREFSGLSISLKQLANILYHTWGRISAFETVEFGELLHKTSPSAGARHPIEAYAIVNHVKGVRSGIYHYSVKDHALELLKQGDFRAKCVDFSAGQSWTYDASVLFIMTAIVARTAWKYRSARVYRAFLLDAGHLSQSFLLVSTALGLGAFSIGIIAESIIEKELGIDGVNEIALFAVGVGHPSHKIEEIRSGRA